MTQALRTPRLHSDDRSLPDLPRGPLSPSQQLAALQRVQEAAEDRVKLGVQLYKAAEQHTVRQQAMIDQVKADQQNLREEIRDDVARSLHAYDHWVGKVDEDFTTALKGLEKRIDDLQAQWARSQERIDTMMHRSESLLNQSKSMVETISRATGMDKPVSASTPPAASPDTTPPAACGLAPSPAAPPTETKEPGLYQSIVQRMNHAAGQ